ncbi:hypothetical protein F5877DRAFT_82141 [Lentinula edodes]|nr:hypothetical protein F5877DRAFT_82141 [Lentinula edodes]
MTSLSTAGLSRFRPALPPPADPVEEDKEDLDEDEDEILRWAEEKFRRMKARKAVDAAKKKAKEEATKKAAEEAQRQKEAAGELEEWIWPPLSRRGSLPGESLVEMRKEKGKGKAKAQPAGGDPNDSNDGDDDDEEDNGRAPCKQCKNKKLSCQMQAGKRSSIPLAILESQMAQLLAVCHEAAEAE